MTHEYKLLPPKIFPGTDKVSAPELAAAYLAETTADGWEPVQIVAWGTAARITIAGEFEGNAFVILRRPVASKAKATK